MVRMVKMVEAVNARSDRGKKSHEDAKVCKLSAKESMLRHR